MKRAFEILVSALGLVLLLPLLLFVALLIKLDSPGPVFFRQERMGRGFRPFCIYKFRTMAQHAPQSGWPITCGDDSRITRVGRFLRRTKVDELPQLLNVFKGEMSLVGPRPEVRRYVELYRKDYEEILTIRPGITDLASLKYRNEATLLGTFERPEEAYVKEVLPDKIMLAKEYLRRSSLKLDATIVFKTMGKLFE